MDCSPIARLMFIGMWNYADDHGRLPLSPKSIKAQVFPSDDISVENIRGMIDELSANGLVRSYLVDGKEYLLITGWHHQKIDKPQKPKYPEPLDNSENVRRTVAPEGKGKEEKVDTEAKASGADAPLDPSIPEREYFLRGREVLGKGNGALIAKLLKAKGGNVALARAAPGHDGRSSAERRGHGDTVSAGISVGLPAGAVSDGTSVEPSAQSMTCCWCSSRVFSNQWLPELSHLA